MVVEVQVLFWAPIKLKRTKSLASRGFFVSVSYDVLIVSCSLFRQVEKCV
jgi:hypothetical protein